VLWLRLSRGWEGILLLLLFWGGFFCFALLGMLVLVWGLGSFVSVKHLGWCSVFLQVRLAKACMHFVVTLLLLLFLFFSGRLLLRCTDTIPIDGFRARVE
jgi:hypothetical protein